MILAVAVSVGVRRVLSRENIYTMKLVRRGHVIPKALHANMFLVRRAERGDGHRRLVLASAEMSFDAFLRQPEHARPHAPRRGDRGRPHRRRAARQHGAAAGVGGRALRRHAGRRRQPQFHDRARGRHRVRRDPAHLAQAGGDGAGRARPRRAAAGATSSASSPRSMSPIRSPAASRCIPLEVVRSISVDGSCMVFGARGRPLPRPARPRARVCENPGNTILLSARRGPP